MRALAVVVLLAGALPGCVSDGPAEGPLRFALVSADVATWECPYAGPGPATLAASLRDVPRADGSRSKAYELAVGTRSLFLDAASLEPVALQEGLRLHFPPYGNVLADEGCWLPFLPFALAGHDASPGDPFQTTFWGRAVTFAMADAVHGQAVFAATNPAGARESLAFTFEVAPGTAFPVRFALDDRVLWAATLHEATPLAGVAPAPGAALVGLPLAGAYQGFPPAGTGDGFTMERAWAAARACGQVRPDCDPAAAAFLARPGARLVQAVSQEGTLDGWRLVVRDGGDVLGVDVRVPAGLPAETDAAAAQVQEFQSTLAPQVPGEPLGTPIAEEGAARAACAKAYPGASVAYSLLSEAPVPAPASVGGVGLVSLLRLTCAADGRDLAFDLFTGLLAESAATDPTPLAP